MAVKWELSKSIKKSVGICSISPVSLGRSISDTSEAYPATGTATCTLSSSELKVIVCQPPPESPVITYTAPVYLRMVIQIIKSSPHREVKQTHGVRAHKI